MASLIKLTGPLKQMELEEITDPKQITEELLKTHEIYVGVEES